MTKFLNNSLMFRNMVGAFAALIIGGTFLTAAAGPAVAATQVNIAANSDIVGVA